MPSATAHETSTTDPVEPEMSLYLTQRLQRRDNEFRKGFDAMFECEYMGSSEFEFGVVPGSLRRMRAAGDLVVHQGQVTRGDVVADVWVVASAGRAEVASAELTRWLSVPRPRACESTGFPQRLDALADPGIRLVFDRVNAWWSLTDDVMWTLDADIAADLIHAVVGQDT